MKLIYSQHDGGYYWQRYGDWAVSQVFATRLEALIARDTDRIRWELPKDPQDALPKGTPQADEWPLEF